MQSPRHQDRWKGAHLAQGCRCLTSGFAFGRSSEMRVSRVDFSGPAQRAPCRRTQGVRDEMWPLSCGSAATGLSISPSEAVLRAHAQGMRMHCTDQRDLDGTASEVVLGVPPWHNVGCSGRAFGAPGAARGPAPCDPEPICILARSSQPCGCREPRPPSSGRQPVLVDEAAEAVFSS